MSVTIPVQALAALANTFSMPSSRNTIYQVKVSLLHTPEGWPDVRRYLQVPANMRLDRFHLALQLSMGWKDCHLHEFRIGERKLGRPDLEEDLGQGPVEDERKFRLDQILHKPNESVMYVYDYGDDWQHEIVLEQILSKEPERQYPVCIDGWYRCPPDDCGGMEDYERLLRMSEDRNLRYLPDYKELQRWLGRRFDPQDFSIDRVNRRLKARFGQSKKRVGSQRQKKIIAREDDVVTEIGGNRSAQSG